MNFRRIARKKSRSKITQKTRFRKKQKKSKKCFEKWPQKGVPRRGLAEAPPGCPRRGLLEKPFRDTDPKSAEILDIRKSFKGPEKKRGALCPGGEKKVRKLAFFMFSKMPVFGPKKGLFRAIFGGIFGLFLGQKSPFFEVFSDKRFLTPRKNPKICCTTRFSAHSQQLSGRHEARTHQKRSISAANAQRKSVMRTEGRECRTF